MSDGNTGPVMPYSRIFHSLSHSLRETEMVKKKLWFCIFGFLIACSHPPLYVRIEKPGSSPDSGLIIPLAFESGLPYVEAVLQDRTTELLLDTGADGFTLGLKPEVLRGMKIKDGKREYSIRRNIYGMSTVDRTFRLPDVWIGPIHYTDLLCTVFRLPQPVRRGGGLVGMDVLKEYNVLIDYKNSRIVFRDPGSDPPGWNGEGWTSMSLEDNRTVKGYLSGIEKPLRIGFDTGSAFFCRGRSYSVFRNRKRRPLYRSIVQGTLNAEGKRLDYVHQTYFTVQGRRIDGLNIVFWDLSLPEDWDLILGHDFFSSHAVCLDYPNKKVFIMPYRDNESYTPEGFSE